MGARGEDHAAVRVAHQSLGDLADPSAGPGVALLGSALFLGNGAAFLPDRSALDGLFRGVAADLSPGASLLLQPLNYARIRALPVDAQGLDPGAASGGAVPTRSVRSILRVIPSSLIRLVA